MSSLGQYALDTVVRPGRSQRSPGTECPGSRAGEKETAISLTNLLNLICVWGLFHPKLASMGKSAVVLSSPGALRGQVGRHIPIHLGRGSTLSVPQAGQQPAVVSCYDVDELSKATGVRTHLERLSSDQGEQPPGWSIGDRAHQAKQPSKAAHPPGCSLTGQANDLQGEAPKAGRPQIQSLKACFGGLAFLSSLGGS